MAKFYAELYEELSLYVRHSAYLNAAPERAKHDKSETPLVSRMEARRKEWAQAEDGRDEDDYRPDMPPVEGAEHLLGYLWEIGPTMAAGMGSGPVTHGEIAAWCDLTGIPLQPWEVKFLRRLSNEYLAESHKATAIGHPAPWFPDGSKPEPTAAQVAIRALANL